MVQSGHRCHANGICTCGLSQFPSSALKVNECVGVREREGVSERQSKGYIDSETKGKFNNAFQFSVL